MSHFREIGRDIDYPPSPSVQKWLSEGNLKPRKSQGVKEQRDQISDCNSLQRYNCLRHLFQGHFKAILVDKNTYLLELDRYAVVKQVRARG